LNVLRKGSLKMTADSSATWDTKVANDFLTGRLEKDEKGVPLLYWYKQRSGKSIERISSHPSEHEVIIREETRYDVVKVHMDKSEWSAEEKIQFKEFDKPELDNIIIIEVEEL